MLKVGIKHSTMYFVLFFYSMLERKKMFTSFLSQVLTSTKKEIKLHVVVTYGKNFLQLQY